MPYEVLQYVVGRALIDPDFQAALMRTPEEALAGVSLSKEERQVLLGAQITSPRALANRIDRWLQSPARAAGKQTFLPHPGSSYDGFEEFADVGATRAAAPPPVVQLLKSA